MRYVEIYGPGVQGECGVLGDNFSQSDKVHKGKSLMMISFWDDDRQVKREAQAPAEKKPHSLWAQTPWISDLVLQATTQGKPSAS